MATLRIDDLEIGYGKNDSVVSAFSLDVCNGEIVSLVGPSGSGKSSVLYAIAGLLRPRRGVVTVNEIDVWQLSDARRADLRRDQIGFLFQDYGLDMGRSVLNNVLEPARYRTGGASKSDHLRAFDLLRSLDVVVPPRRKPSQISGGQAQRIGLARALISMPAILVADEPTSSLDDDSASAVLETIRNSIENGDVACAVIATHDPRVTRISDAVSRIQ